jgi:hypothetical protein
MAEHADSPDFRQRVILPGEFSRAIQTGGCKIRPHLPATPILPLLFASDTGKFEKTGKEEEESSFFEKKEAKKLL